MTYSNYGITELHFFTFFRFGTISGAVAKKLQVVIVHVVIVHVVELQAVTSYIVTRSKNVLVTLQHVQLQVTTGKTGKNSSKTSNLKRLRAFLCLVMSNNALLLHFFVLFIV